MKMLIVDDDEINRKLLQALVKPFGSTEQVENGLDAIASYQAALELGEPYEVIFLDIMMPLMNGHDCLAKLRELEWDKGLEKGEGSKVVMVTALGDARNVMTAFSAGAEYYLVKPIQQKKLYELMSEMGYQPSQKTL
ncbi:MAG: response regulator [bacterium]|nr:response regulator [bacterium]